MFKNFKKGFIQTPTSKKMELSYKNWIIGKLVSGFTLVELMIAVSIVTSMMAVVLYDYSNFTDKQALSSAAQEVALAIREAQVYGISAKESQTSSGSDYTIAYGIFFDPLWGFHATNYYTFRDRNGDYIISPFTSDCNDDASHECNKINEFKNGVIVHCVGQNSASCSTSNSMVHITFKRPNTDAIIYFTNQYWSITSSNNSQAVIRLRSPKGKTIDVIVQNTGQVEIQ